MTGSRSQGVGYAVGATEPRRATCERSRSMPTNLRYVGRDVHAETIAVAVAEPDGEVRPLGIIPNRPEAVAKLIHKLRPSRAALGVLRGRALRLRPLLAADQTRCAL